MKELAKDFYKPMPEVLEKMSKLLKKLVLSKNCASILNDLKIDFENEPFSNSLEIFLGTLYSLRYYYEQIKDNTTSEGRKSNFPS